MSEIVLKIENKNLDQILKAIGIVGKNEEEKLSRLKFYLLGWLADQATKNMKVKEKNE